MKYIINLYSTLLHKFWVFLFMTRLALKIFWRGMIHDNSKLYPDEFSGFSSVIKNLKGSTFGSSDYDAAKAKIANTIELHYTRNRHHPEHWFPINPEIENRKQDCMPLSQTGMDLLDLIEMHCDWKAAVKRHKNGNIARSIEFNKARFKMSEDIINIFVNTH